MKIIKINAVWCPACLVVNNVWNKILIDYPDLDITTLDYDIDEDEVKKYNVGDVLPVMIFIQDGVEVKRLVGEKKYEEIKGVIDEYV